MPGADKQERWPGALNGIFIEEFDAAKGDSAGAATPFFNVFTVQEVISQILFGNLARGFAEMFTQLANGSDIKSLCTFAVASELYIFGHPLSQGCHGVPPFYMVNENG